MGGGGACDRTPQTSTSANTSKDLTKTTPDLTPYLTKRRVLGMVMVFDWVVTGSVVSTQKGPAAVWRVVGGATVEEVAVEEQSVTCDRQHKQLSFSFS